MSFAHRDCLGCGESVLKPTVVMDPSPCAEDVLPDESVNYQNRSCVMRQDSVPDSIGGCRYQKFFKEMG